MTSPIAGTVKNLPCHGSSGFVQRWRRSGINSFRRPPRVSNAIPVEVNSSSTQPAPAPTSSLPSERRSRVASSRAIRTGGRKAIWLTLVPRITRSVTAATNASPIQGSTSGWYGCGRSSGTATRSLSQTESKPALSAFSAIRLSVRSLAGPILTPIFSGPSSRERRTRFSYGRI